MSYESALMKVETEEKRRARHARNAEVWEEILNSDDYDQTPGTAFANQVIAWCNGSLTRDAYDLLCATSGIPGFETSEWHKGDKQFYVNLVVEKLRSSHNWPDDRIREKVKELSNKSKKEVRAYLNEIQFRETVRTVEDARDFLSRHRLLAQQRQFADSHGALWPRLPKLVVPEGFVTAIPLDAKFLYKILDASGLRKYVSRYSLEQINERIANTSDSLQGEIQ